MAHGSCGKTVTKDTLHISLIKGQNLVLLKSNNRLFYLFTYQISLTNSYYCSKQKLTSCVILIIPNFLARFVQKMSMTKIKLFSVTSVSFGLLLHVTTLIIQITGIWKTLMNPGTAQDVVAQSFLLTLYQATKTSWLVVLTLIASSHSGKIQKMITIVHYH